MGVGQYRKCISKAFAILLESVVWHMWQNVWLKLFFGELAFICVQTGLGSIGESLPDVGVFGATATATAKLHIGWFEQTLWKREKENGFGEKEKQGLKDVHCLKIPGVYYHLYSIQILDIFGHFGYWPKSGLSLLLHTRVVSFHLQQFFLFFGKSKLNWCCWCYMWVAQCSSLVYPLQSSLQHKLEGRGELLPGFSLAAYLESCNIRDSLVKIAKSVSISPWLRLTYRFLKIKFVSILSEKFPLKKKEKKSPVRRLPWKTS